MSAHREQFAVAEADQCRVPTATGLRRVATSVHADATGWDVLTVPFGDTERLADAVLR